MSKDAWKKKLAHEQGRVRELEFKASRFQFERDIALADHEKVQEELAKANTALDKLTATLAENQVKLLAATATINTLAKLMTPETNLVPLDKNGVPQP
jgi:capsule polysaccharide export protein KpsE/RkpR